MRVPARAGRALIVECVGLASCEAIAAVGSVHLIVTLPGDVSKTVALHQLIDGVFQGDPPSVTTSLAGNHTEGVQTINVPGGVADGATWILRGQLEGAIQDTVVTLRIPTISSSLSCGSSCRVTVGTAIGLSVVAPRDIRPRKAVQARWRAQRRWHLRSDDDRCHEQDRQRHPDNHSSDDA